MDFEVLKKDNRKYWITGIIVIILLASVIFFVGTKAKYRLTQKINIASGTVNWHPPVFSIVSIKTSNDGTNYSNASSVPTSGYTLSNKSYCEVRGVKDSSATISYSNGNVTVNTSNINTKCFLYFDRKPLARDTILAGKTIDTSRSGSITNQDFTKNTTGTIFTKEDADGTSYFYAGAVNDNWVKFGGFYWRIIRFNGDGSIRMIYNGTANRPTGTHTYIGSYNFARSDGIYDDNMYVGYMYKSGEVHGTTTSSYVKQKIDEWYNANLNKSGIREYIDTEAGFCGDRGSNTNVKGGVPNGTGGTGKTITYYASSLRFYTGDSYTLSMKSTMTPTLTCADSRDLYTVNSSSKGNKALTYPVGLITIDEVILAGGVSWNEDFYLYTGYQYWTMTPWIFNSSGATVHIVAKDGWVSYLYLYASAGARPVINLKADVALSGDGTSSNPYQIA